MKIQVTEAMENQREKEKRINNIMVFNVEETEVSEGQEIDRDDEMKHDVTSLSNILSTVDRQFNKSSIESVIRLGRRKGNEEQKFGPRPIKVTLVCCCCRSYTVELFTLSQSIPGVLK